MLAETNTLVPLKDCLGDIAEARPGRSARAKPCSSLISMGLYFIVFFWFVFSEYILHLLGGFFHYTTCLDQLSLHFWRLAIL